MSEEYTSNVFVNCPFDDIYLPIRNAIIFSVFDCGFIPRCALENDDSGEIRFVKIMHLIEISKYGIHDISRTEVDPVTNLPRFNMALELGVFLGARAFGQSSQKQKSCLILDTVKYRYQTYISDISGQDIQAHANKQERVIACVRNWLGSASRRSTIPSGAAIARRYREFSLQLPSLCEAAEMDPNELPYNDFTNYISEWLRMN